LPHRSPTVGLICASAILSIKDIDHLEKQISQVSQFTMNPQIASILRKN
jgi:hypothetical protein